MGYCKNFNDAISGFLSNDAELVNTYGNIDTIKKLIFKYNINIQITQEYSKIDLFDLICDLSNQYECNLDDLFI